MGNRVDNRYENNRHVIEQISAYLDGALDDAVSSEVRAHIDDCSVCHAEYTEVRATRQMLRSVPLVQPPRAFTLTPEMVHRRVSLWERLLVPRNVPRLATGSVMAFALVLMLLVGNVGGIASLGNNSSATLASGEADLSVKLAPPSGEIRPASTPEFMAQPVMPGGGATQTQDAITNLGEAPTAEAANRASTQVTSTAVATGQAYNSAPTPSELMDGSIAGGGPLPPVQPMSPATLTLEAPAPTDGVKELGLSPQTNDVTQLLVISLTGLLVALGGAFAVGAVVAARR